MLPGSRHRGLTTTTIVIYLLHQLGIKMGARALRYSELSPHQLGPLPTVIGPRWTAKPCVLYHVCAASGARVHVHAQFLRDTLCCSVRLPCPTCANQDA